MIINKEMPLRGLIMFIALSPESSPVQFALSPFSLEGPGQNKRGNLYVGVIKFGTLLLHLRRVKIGSRRPVRIHQADLRLSANSVPALLPAVTGETCGRGSCYAGSLFRTTFI